MRPLLKQQDRTPSTGTALGDERDLRRVDQAGILASVDKSGEVAIMVVGPARRFVGNLRQRFQRSDRLPRHVEHAVVFAPRDPQHRIVLLGGHPIVARPDNVVVEALDPAWRGIAGDSSPELRPKPRNEVDAAHRRTRLAEACYRRDEPSLLHPAPDGELDIAVRGRAEGEDSRLWADGRSLDRGVRDQAIVSLIQRSPGECLPMYRTIVRDRYKKAWAAMNAHDYEAIVSLLAESFEVRFIGDTSLGGSRHTREAMRAWFQRCLRRLSPTDRVKRRLPGWAVDQQSSRHAGQGEDLDRDSIPERGVVETDPGHRVTRHHGGQRKGEVRHDEDGGEERTAAGRRGEPDKASHHAKPGDSESDAGRRGAAKEQERRVERNRGDGEGQPGGQGHSPEPHRPGCLPRTNRDHADGANTGEKCDRQPAESSIVRRGELQGQARTQREIEPGDAPARN